MEEFHKRFGRRQANQSSGVKCTSHTRLWWALIDIPRRWRIDRRYRQLRLLQGLDDGRKRLADLTGETETCEK